jgi:AraC-like DNA-binding protein
MADPVSEQNGRVRTGGRPEYKPTEEQRAEVRRMVGDNTQRKVIAKAVGVSVNTLRKHFAAELATAAATAEPAQLELTGTHQVQPTAAPGRPEFEPTERQRQMVRLWAADDWTEDRMAQQLGIARNTLRKHFEQDLQFGADRVRTQVLLDLQRGSQAGKVAASNKLLELTGLVAPPAPPKPEQQDDEPLGKKAQAKVDARTAEVGTGWSQLVN